MIVYCDLHDEQFDADYDPVCRKCADVPSWKPEVQADSSGTWSGNALRFSDKRDAEEWAENLSHRWMLVRAWRVVPCEEEPNR